MARIAALEEALDIRDEEDVDMKSALPQKSEDAMDESINLEEPITKRPLIATANEINDAFQSIITLRYSQPTHLAGLLYLSSHYVALTVSAGKCHGITITPYAAGHTIGGTLWKIRSPSAGTIMYAVNLNHLKERHLDGSVLTLSTGGGVFEPLARPEILITDAERALIIGSRKKERDGALLGEPLLFSVICM